MSIETKKDCLKSILKTVKKINPVSISLLLKISGRITIVVNVEEKYKMI